MRWRDVADQLERQPGFRAAYEQQFPYANVALAVVALRERHELTQRALADLAGTPQPVIARLESGRHPVEIKLLSRIAAAVGERWDVTFDGRLAEADNDVSAPFDSGDPLLDAFNEANTAADFEGASQVAAEIARDPSTPRRKLALALDAYNRREHDAAERWSREALDAPDLPEASREVAQLVVGRSILNQGRAKDAIRVLRPLRRPKHIGWLRDAALAEAYLEAGQPDAAQTAVDRVLRASPPAEAHYLAARILWHRDQVWPALEQVTLFRAADPEDPSGLLLHGSILGYLGDSRDDADAHRAALALFERARPSGDCEAIRLHGVTAARVGDWATAFADAESMLADLDGHHAERHRVAAEEIASAAFAHMPDDVAWAEPTARAEALLGADHELVRLQRALLAAIGGDVDAATTLLGLDQADIATASAQDQLVVAAAMLGAGRTAEATGILARNAADLSVPDGFIRLAGTALEADDFASARIAFDRLSELAGPTGQLAMMATHLLAAVDRARASGLRTGVLALTLNRSDLFPREGPVAATDSTWEGRHGPTSAVMDRVTRAFLH